MADFRLLARTHGFMKLAEIVRICFRLFCHDEIIVEPFCKCCLDYRFDLPDPDPHLLVEFRRRCTFGSIPRPLQCRIGHSRWYVAGVSAVAHLLPVEHLGNVSTVPGDHLQHAGFHSLPDGRFSRLGPLPQLRRVQRNRSPRQHERRYQRRRQVDGRRQVGGQSDQQLVRFLHR